MHITEQTSSGTVAPGMAQFHVSESAAARINALKTEENNQQLRFRVSVKGGGCSGFQYEFSLDGSVPAENDMVFGKDGAEVVIDDISISMVAGGTLDYTEDLSHAGFDIKNPNATASCGCGNSFSIPI